MRRVSVVGGSGSGKTTTGRAIADRMGVSFVEIDALHWTHPGWELPPLEEFRASVDAATRGDAWVVDGSYGKVRDIVWSRADTVVWLDLPLRVSLSRVTRRTIGRIRTGEELWNGNRESWRGGFFGWNSMVVWATRSHLRLRRARAIRLTRYPGLEVVRLRSAREVERYLSG